MIKKSHDTIYIQFSKDFVYNQRMFQRSGTESDLEDYEKVILKLVERNEELAGLLEAAKDEIEYYQMKDAGEDY